MRFYIAYRYTGEDPAILRDELADIENVIKASGHDVFCSISREKYFLENKFTPRQVIDYSLNELQQSDVLLAYIKSPEKSEGMILEIGFAIAKQKPVYVLIKEGIKTGYIEGAAEKVVVFNEFSEVENRLSEALR